MEDSLSNLDATLVDRMNVPLKLLADDYAAVAGTHGTAADDSSCAVDFRLFATSWIAPWGSILPWILPPSSRVVLDSGNTKVTLAIPQSRIRHFLSDASLRVVGIAPTEEFKGLSLVSAQLRLGPNKPHQSLDSQFACEVAWQYKSSLRLVDTIKYDASDMSYTFVTPLFFDLPLRVVPLFLPDAQVVVEYELTGVTASQSIEFLTEVISSPGEIDISVADPSAKTVVQHMPSFTTFSSGQVTAESTVSIPLPMPADKLVRALYIRVGSGDLANVVKTIDVVNRSRSLVGGPLPGSICHNHLKRRFSKTGWGKLPYYVVPFAVSPSGNNADYGVLFTEGTELQVILTPQVGPVTIDVCVETSERVVWKR